MILGRTTSIEKGRKKLDRQSSRICSQAFQCTCVGGLGRLVAKSGSSSRWDVTMPPSTSFLGWSGILLHPAFGTAGAKQHEPLSRHQPPTAGIIGSRQVWAHASEAGRPIYPGAYRFFSESSIGDHFGVTGGRGTGRGRLRRFGARGGSCSYGDAENVNDIWLSIFVSLRVLDSSQNLGITCICSPRIRI